MSPPERRRRRGSDGLVLISWRDIPAQVNAGTGDARVQRILPRRFQRAIDRAAMVAGKTQASQYVGEWRRTVIPANSADPEAAALAAAAELEEAFPRERLELYVKTGGWDPSAPAPEGRGPDARDAAASDSETGDPGNGDPEDRGPESSGPENGGPGADASDREEPA